MRNQIAIFVSLFFIITSCKVPSKVQLFETKSDGLSSNDPGEYFFTNDEIKVSYKFWHNRGLVTFTIHNISDKPIYIDWKKSSLIVNSVKLDYWADQTSTNSTSLYETYSYNEAWFNTVSSRSSTIQNTSSLSIKMERITFIPPHSTFEKSQFYISTSKGFLLPTDTPFEEVQDRDKPKKNQKIYSQEFKSENSPIKFRNFLTYAFDENISSEIRLDHSFYISKISEMNKDHFQYNMLDPAYKMSKIYIKDENGNLKAFSDFYKATDFYLYIPYSSSVSYRK